MKKITNKTLRNYVSPEGSEPFQEWLDSLKDATTRARIRRRLDRVELGNFGDHASVGDGVFELRLFFGSGYRIYYAEFDDLIVILLCGGDKSSQKQDIEDAKSYLKELEERKNES